MSETKEVKEVKSKEPEKVVYSPSQELKGIFKEYEKTFVDTNLFNSLKEIVGRIQKYENVNPCVPEKVEAKKYKYVFEVIKDYSFRWRVILKKLGFLESFDFMKRILESFEKRSEKLL